MKPDKKEPFIEMPLTIDVRNSFELEGRMKVYWTIIIVLACTFISVVLLVIVPSKITALIMISILTFVAQFLTRTLLIREKKYKKAVTDLEENEYQMGYDEVWDILSVDAVEPFTVRFRNGATGFFVMLEKGSKIGKPPTAEYEHHEAVADALQILVGKKIQYYYIDFMDTTNRDGRLDGVRSQYRKAPENIGRYLEHKYDFLEQRMKDEYTAYDVVLAYTPLHIGDEHILYEGLREFSDYLVESHYIHVKLMDILDIERLSRILFNSDSFNAIEATASLATRAKSTRFLRKIYTVDEDGHKEVYAETRVEKAEKDRIKRVEKKALKSRKKIKKEEDEEVELM